MSLAFFLAASFRDPHLQPAVALLHPMTGLRLALPLPETTVRRHHQPTTGTDVMLHMVAVVVFIRLHRPGEALHPDGTARDQSRETESATAILIIIGGDLIRDRGRGVARIPPGADRGVHRGGIRGIGEGKVRRRREVGGEGEVQAIQAIRATVREVEAEVVGGMGGVGDIDRCARLEKSSKGKIRWPNSITIS